MQKYSYLNNANPAFIEDLYDKYKQNPSNVNEAWQRFFEGYEFSGGGQIQNISASTAEIISSHAYKEVAVVKLINAYRGRGHMIGKTSPVGAKDEHKRDLEPSYYGLDDHDLDTIFESGREIHIGPARLSEIIAHLQKTYCGSIGPEFRYCRNEQLRQWLYLEMEPIANTPKFENSEKLHILKKIDEAVTFENFLQTKFVGKKRFSLEGLESVIPALDSAIEESARLGAAEFVLGMAHRGRLNVLVNIFGKSYEEVFTEFGNVIGANDRRGGDVKYHLGQSGDIVTKFGTTVHLTLVPNPSHLEAVNPVVEGLVHAKSQLRYEHDTQKIIPILIHGDAAYSGQGVNYEVAQMSKLAGYENGGTVHIIMNNQIGFTTTPIEGRSSGYCTDLAKVSESPVFHVNGDDPEAVVHAVRMAVKLRQRFGVDVYVDVIGYRRYGHNEGDEPRFTQPILYREIDQRPDAYQVYLKRLISEGEITQEIADSKRNELSSILQAKLDAAQKRTSKAAPKLAASRTWRGLRFHKAEDFLESVQTGVSKKQLDEIAKSLVTVPESFNLYRKMAKLLEQRSDGYFKQGSVDWGMAELLAYGSLLIEMHPVRLSGQDCQRGTFSHRHAVIKDVENETTLTPLNSIRKKQAKFSVYNSLLSEYAVLGFEFGYSMALPQGLTIWEAQFGDFANGAQIIIDQFLCSSEVKWGRMSGLTLLLPHAQEGQGPEHSSGRIERFLQLCADNNMYIVNATTPANFFHALRRQVKTEFRIPLVVFSPKSLLRHPDVKSPIQDLVTGKFEEVIDDSGIKPDHVKRVLFCSGKVYYDLLSYRSTNEITDTAIVRLEQLYPLNFQKLNAIKKKYKKAKDLVWVQEEPNNQGAWSHVLRLFPFSVRCISREASSSPSTGNEAVYKQTQAEIVAESFR